MHQSLADVPLVRRHLEVALKLLLERGERTVTDLRELLDRDIFEHVVVDNLLEISARNIHISHKLALQTAIAIGDYQVEQLGKFYIFSSLVVAKELLAQITVSIRKETLGRIPRRHRYMVVRATPLAGVIIRKSHAIGYAQMREDVLQTGRRIVEDNLLKRGLGFTQIFDVMVADSHKKYLSSVDRVAFIAVVDILNSGQNVSDGIARQKDGSNIRRG